MSLYLPTPQKIGLLAFCITEISLIHANYAYLKVSLENGHETIIFYQYPPRYWEFLHDLARHTPLHNVHFIAGDLLSFSNKSTPCPCQRAARAPAQKKEREPA